MSTPPNSAEETPEELSRKSEAVRERLLSHIDALKDRGEEVADVAKAIQRQAKRHAPVLIGAGAIALVTFGVVALRSRERRRRRARQDAVLYAAARLLGPSFEVRRTERESLIGNGLRRAGKQLLALASRELGRRVLAELRLSATDAPEEDEHPEGAASPEARKPRKRRAAHSAD